MNRRQVLVVEDDAPIRRGIVDALQAHGYLPIEAADGHAAIKLALGRPIELMLLDLMLPLCGGLDVLAQVRDARPTLPVIILTARGEENDRVAGLRLGADDYVVKPFSVRELIARVEAVLRRSPERPDELDEIPLPAGVVDVARREVRFGDGVRAELSERELCLIRYLAQHAGRAISRQEILTRVWQLDPAGVETRTIDMHVARLREKLRDNGESPMIILTVRGKGYMFGQGTGVASQGPGA
jgi:DNA-binding response OmpR family regulator